MDSELNNYNITNADGVAGNIRDENRIVCNNENPRYIQENSLAGQKENVSVPESFGSDKKSAVKENNAVSQADAGQSRAASASSSTTASSAATSVSASATASSAASSVASAIGGSVGALAGTVATAVMSAAIVVAAFVSTLVINLTLLMATTTSLVFNVELSGAQEEDFATPIYAVLTDGGDFYLQQEITQGTTVISFEELEAGKEYFITVKNQEKVFYSKSYVTATEDVDRGEVFVAKQSNEFLLTVDNVNLKRGEYYTVTVKDEKGNVVFVKDATDSFAEYTFTADAKELFVSLAINGSVCSVAQIDAEHYEPEYDYANPTWAWADDFSGVQVTFGEIHGGEPLVASAVLTSEITVAPSCLDDGVLTYTATYGDSKDTKEVPINALGHDYRAEITAPTCTAQGYTTHVCSRCQDEYIDTYVAALGHDYGEPVCEWTENELTGGYTAKFVRTCTRDGDKDIHDAEVGSEVTAEPSCVTEGTLTYTATYGDSKDTKEVPIGALGHDYREEITQPTCTEQGYTTHVCSRCQDEYIDTYVNELGHEYGEPVCEWTVDELTGGFTAQFVRTCVRGDDKIVYNAEVGSEVTAEPSCVTEGTLTYTATYGDYVDTKNEILPAAGHAYGELIPENYNDNGLFAHYECSVCHSLFDSEKRGTTYDDLVIPRGVALSLNDGFIGIDPTGYARSHSDSNLINATSYVSSESDPYIISGSIYADESLDVYNMTGTKKTFYLCFKDVYIQSGMWATAFRIIADSDLDIYIVNEGSTTIQAGNHYGIEVQSKGNVNVNLYVTGSESFSLSGDNGRFGVAGSGTCTLYINGVKQ